MPVLAHYQQQVQENKILADDRQRQVMQALQIVFDDLIHEQRKRSSFYFWRKPKAVKGLYMWGGVGIGKTWMMDCFYQCLPLKNKIRMHFHAFMQFVHAELKRYQGKKNPLHLLATQLAKNTILFCFDELVVTDITDAMLLTGLLPLLHAKGVCIIATSNTTPNDLYKNGLQRELFLPVIELLERSMQVISINTIRDYRLLDKTKNHSTASELKLKDMFEKWSVAPITHHQPIVLHHRLVHTVMHSENSIWFEFKDICSPPRSTADYISLVSQYDTIMVSNIPRISSEQNNTITLFIKMIDVFYDARIRFIFSSDVPIENIYLEGRMKFQFARTQSRLHEMQSSQYSIQNKM